MTSARLNYVTGPRIMRRRRSTAAEQETGALSCYIVAMGVKNYVRAMWAADRFSPLDKPWLPTLPISNATTPEQKLVNLVELANEHLRLISHGSWTLALDRDDRPSALLLDRADGPCEVITLRLDGRLLHFAGTPLSLAGPIGVKLLNLIAARCGSSLGAW